MQRFGRKPVSALALAAAIMLTLGSGCRGFFVHQPNSMSVTTATGGSTFSVPPDSQMKAVATYDDGTKDVTSSATWQSSSACVTVTSGGLVSGHGAVSTVTISATVAGVSGSISGTSTGGSGGQTLTLSPNTNLTFAANTSTQFTAALNGQDVTASATWTSSNTTAVTFSSTTNGLATFVSPGNATISASVLSGGTCASASEDVTVQ
jgi:trimeric autotransporter adhesin